MATRIRIVTALAGLPPLLAWLLCLGEGVQGGEVSRGELTNIASLCHSVTVAKHFGLARPLSDLNILTTIDSNSEPLAPRVSFVPSSGHSASAAVDAATGCLMAFYSFEPPLSKGRGLVGEEEWTTICPGISFLAESAGLRARGVGLCMERPPIVPEYVVLPRVAAGFSFLNSDRLHFMLDAARLPATIHAWNVNTTFLPVPETGGAKHIDVHSAQTSFERVVTDSVVLKRFFGQTLKVANVRADGPPCYVYENRYFDEGEDPCALMYYSPIHLCWVFKAELVGAQTKANVKVPLLWGYVDVVSGEVVGGGSLPYPENGPKPKVVRFPRERVDQHVRSVLLAIELADKTPLGQFTSPRTSISEQRDANGRSVLVVADDLGQATLDIGTGTVVAGSWPVAEGDGGGLPSLVDKDSLITVRNELKKAKLFKHCGYYNIAIRFEWSCPAVNGTRLRFPRVVGNLEVENEYFEVLLAERRPLRAKEIKTNCSFLYPADTDRGEVREASEAQEGLASCVAALPFPAGIACAIPVTSHIDEHQKYAAPNAFFNSEDAARKYLERCRIIRVPARQAEQEGEVVVYWSIASNRPVGGRFAARSEVLPKPSKLPRETIPAASQPAPPSDTKAGVTTRRPAAQRTQPSTKFRALVIGLALAGVLAVLGLARASRRRRSS